MSERRDSEDKPAQPEDSSIKEAPRKDAAVFKPPIRREAPPELSRGLSAVEASRVERNKIKRPPFKIVVWFGMTLIVALILYFRWESSQVESARQRLLTKQRQAISAFGGQWFEVRDNIESWTLELAKKQDVNYTDPELKDFKFRDMPGIYLRLRKDQAQDVKSVRESAQGSFRDGFTSCLMRVKNDPQLAGKECHATSECEPGEICNDLSHCSKPGQPYNLRLAYRSFSVLEPEFEKEARETSNSLTLRALDLAFEDASRLEFPLAVDLLAKARFFLGVIDDRPPPVSRKKEGDKGPSAEDQEDAAGATFPARVVLYRLSDNKLMLRLTAEPKAELHGGQAVPDVEVAAALHRQAQSCALADEVLKASGY